MFCFFFFSKNGKKLSRLTGEWCGFRLHVTKQEERRRDGQENGEQLDQKLGELGIIQVSAVEIALIVVGYPEFPVVNICDAQRSSEKKAEENARDEQSRAFVEPKRTTQIDSNERKQTKVFTRYRKHHTIPK